MYYRCELLVGGLSYDVTDNIKNWDDIVVSFKRNDYDGVARTFTDKFEFVKGARVVLLNEYKNYYLKSTANIVVSTRNNSWTWTERFRCALNFSTLSDDGFTLTLNAIDDSVASIIKAKKSTQYEYNVSELTETRKLNYDRMNMSNTIKWVDGGSISEDNSESFIEFYSDYSPANIQAHTFPLYIEAEEIANVNKCEFKDADFDHFSNGSKVPPFFKALEKMRIHLSFSFQIYGTGALGSEVYSSNTNIRLIKKLADGGYEELKSWSVYGKSYRITDVSFDEDIDLNENESLSLTIGTFNVYAGDKLYILNSIGFDVKFTSRGNAVELDIISPQKLLNKLLQSMDGSLSGAIVPSGEKRLDNAMILAAESARKIPNAKIYSSFDKFSKWMSSVFGYVYDINGKVVTFRPRMDYFSNSVVKEIKDFNGYSMSVNSSLIYSQVDVGYDKQDYDSVNGKDEFRFTNVYDTGVTITSNKLELKSPYRADAYGIEFLAQKIGEETTDSSSDTDVFFVSVNSNETNYTLDRSTSISGVISPETMFNAMYSPTSMISANEPFLGGFISELNYASSDGNSSVTIEGKAENRDISINDGIFTVNEIEIETSDIEIPDNMTGIIQFEYQGKTIQGYYKSTDFSYTKTKSAKITLIEKK